MRLRTCSYQQARRAQLFLQILLPKLHALGLLSFLSARCQQHVATRIMSTGALESYTFIVRALQALAGVGRDVRGAVGAFRSTACQIMSARRHTRQGIRVAAPRVYLHVAVRALPRLATGCPRSIRQRIRSQEGLPRARTLALQLELVHESHKSKHDDGDNHEVDHAVQKNAKVNRDGAVVLGLRQRLVACARDGILSA